MTPPTLSIVVPTCGRPSLARLLADLIPQLAAGDEVVVVGDGPQPAACGLAAAAADPRVRYFEHADPASRYGNAQRNHGLDQARGARLAFFDDDDEVPPDALALIRRDAAAERPVLFRMRYGETLLWADRSVRPTNVGGPQLVVPNVPGRLARWPVPAADPPTSDYEWIGRALAQWPADALVWSEAVVYHARGHSGGAPPAEPLGVPERIPRVLHQLWIGPAPAPRRLMAAWRDLYVPRGWAYRLWTEAELAAEPLRLGHLADATAEWNGKADVFRWELLHRYGGLFVDADSEPVQPIPDAFLRADFFSCYEHESVRPGLVACGAMGAAPGAAVTARVLERLEAGGPAAVGAGGAWRTVGPGLLTDVLASGAGLSATVFPARHFIPEHYTGAAAPGDGPVYARQHWGSTRGTYPALADAGPAPESPVPPRPAPPAETLAGKWDGVYARGEPAAYGPPVTYRLAALFLGDCELVEDWGCGWGWFRRFLPAGAAYRGVDGSRSPAADAVAELAGYRPPVRPDGVLLRHVLDHNPDWEAVLGNALRSFGRKLCLVFFTPLVAGERAVPRGHDAGVGVHDWSLPRDRLEALLRASGVAWWTADVRTGCTPYGSEEVYFVTREPPPETAPGG